MTSICIIGGSGFIGTSIASRLRQQKIAFTIVDQNESRTFPEACVLADIRDSARLHGVVKGECILHLAAVHRDDIRPVSLYDDVNVEGTRNICAAAEANGIEQIVFASSVAVYGFAPKDTDENGAISPFNDYGRTKAEGERVLREWQARDPKRRSLTMIRPTVVFGPGNRGNVYNLFNQIARRRFVMIGNGQNYKSIAYVENVADFFLHSLRARPGVHVFNYVDGPELDMNQLVSLVRGTLFGKADVGLRLPQTVGYALGGLADAVAKMTGKSLPLSRQRVQKFVSTTSFSTRYAQEHGFSARFQLSDAIQTTLRAEFIEPDPDRPVFETE